MLLSARCGSAAGSVQAKPCALAKAPEEAGDLVGHFTRSGNPREVEPGGEPTATVDPLALSLSHPFSAARLEAVRPAAPISATEIAVLEQVVERLSLGGDRRAATARLELGGMWAGAVLVVRASGKEVELRLEGGRNGAESRALGERLAARLRSRGFETALSVS